MAEKAPSRRPRLDQPSVTGRTYLPRYDDDAFGRTSERIARFLGTSKFLVYLTVIVIVWLAYNTLAPEGAQFDPRASNFTLLTLILSLQASYAAPLILLAQNRQTDRDRVAQEEDRAQNARLQADVEYLTRELASLRTSLGEVATRDFLRDQLREVTEDIVARSAAGTAEAVYDRQKRVEREERERRAERKRRREAQRETTRGEEQPAGLGDPFVGDEADS
ncbi:MAG: hypothetical protein JWO60_616 [Frankiales bacterium]|nr:hypothetical protein [Frankiales bacterium]